MTSVPPPRRLPVSPGYRAVRGGLTSGACDDARHGPLAFLPGRGSRAAEGAPRSSRPRAPGAGGRPPSTAPPSATTPARGPSGPVPPAPAARPNRAAAASPSPTARPEPPAPPRRALATIAVVLEPAPVP